MFCYKIYGLTIASEVELEEAVPLDLIDNAIDVTIKFGDITIDVQKQEDICYIKNDWYYYINKRERVFYSVLGFLFEICDGNTIIISSEKPIQDKVLLNTLLLGTALAVIFMQRNCIPVHGAAVVKNNTTSIISGFSGVGKSAILSVLIENGYKYLSDDVTIVSWKDGKAMVLPGYPQRKLTLDSAQELEIPMENVMIANEDYKDKLHIRNKAEWCDEEKELNNFIELLKVDALDDEFSFKSQVFTGHQSLKLVMRNLYRPKFHEQIGFTPLQMKQLFQMVSTICVKQAARKSVGYPIRECGNEIIKIIE